MDRALWVVIGKVSALMLLAGVVSLSRAGPVAVAVVALGLAAYAVSIGNLLRTGSADEDVPDTRRRAVGSGHLTDGGRWSRDP